MEFIYHDPFGSMEKYMPKMHIFDHIFMDASLHDDLETIHSMIQKFNGIKLDVDQKSIFYLPKLNSLQIAKLNRRDIEFSKTFYNFPNDEYDIPVADMVESNSKAKFELWDGLRTTLTIPSDDYPLLTTYRDGNFILPLCEEFLYNPLFPYIDIEENEGLITMKFNLMDFDQYDINFESKFISKNQIECFIKMSVERNLYHQLSLDSSESRYPYLKKYEESVIVIKEKGDRCVYVGVKYVEECSLLREISANVPIDWEKFAIMQFPPE